MRISLKIKPDQYFCPLSVPGSGGEGDPDMVISTLKAGDMSIQGKMGEKNRKELYARLGIEAERVASIRQIHSKRIFPLENVKGADSVEGDGLITGNRMIILSVTVADCVPIFIFSRNRTVFGLLHSGWKGTGIAGNAVEMFREHFSTAPEDLSVVIGPSIGPCCYRVDSERGEYFAGQWGEETVIKRDGACYLDLRTANAALFEKAGVRAVALVENCTCCDPNLGSYRREGDTAFTKMVALIGYFK